MTSTTTIAVDGLPASPVMARALEKIAALGADKRAVDARIATDGRLAHIRSFNTVIEHGDGMIGGLQVFASLANGGIAREARIKALAAARISQLRGFTCRDSLARAARCRAQSIARPVVADAFAGGVMLSVGAA